MYGYNYILRTFREQLEFNFSNFYIHPLLWRQMNYKSGKLAKDFFLYIQNISMFFFVDFARQRWLICHRHHRHHNRYATTFRPADWSPTVAPIQEVITRRIRCKNSITNYMHVTSSNRFVHFIQSVIVFERSLLATTIFLSLSKFGRRDIGGGGRSSSSVHDPSIGTVTARLQSRLYANTGKGRNYYW